MGTGTKQRRRRTVAGSLRDVTRVVASASFEAVPAVSARLVVGCLIGTATLAVVQCGLLTSSWLGAELDGGIATSIDVVAVALVCVTGVAFLTWVYGAAATALTLPGPVHLRSARGMVISYLIPILSLYRPYRDMLALVIASDPTTLPEPAVRDQLVENPDYRSSARRRRDPPVATWARSVPVGRWWALWLGVPCASLLLALLDDRRHPSSLGLALLRVVYVYSCFSAAVVVRGITSRLTERARRAALSTRAEEG